MSILVLQKHDLVGLKLSKDLLDFLLGELICITDVHILIKDFVVENLGELDSRLIEDCLVLVNTDNMWHSCLDEYAADLF